MEIFGVNLDVVEILQTGVTGFSFLMLFVVWKLTSSNQKKIFEKDTSNISPEKLAVWENMAAKQTANTRYFMGFTLVVLIASLFALTFTERPEATILLTLSPIKDGYHPIVHAQNKAISLDKNGKGSALLKDDHTLAIDNKHVFNKLDELEKSLSISLASEKAAAKEKAQSSSLSGFGTLISGK